MKVLFFSFFLATSIFAADDPYFLDYIYVNANTGQSSGGHSAIRLGDIVYHFQYFPDKIFHIIREPWEEFRYVYGIQENRTIFIEKIRLTKQNFQFFLERMNEIYLYQKKELDNLEKLENDVKILDSIIVGNETVNIRAAGYFSDGKERKGNFHSLKSKINSKFGQNYLLKRLHLVRCKINSFKIPVHLIKPVDSKSMGFPRGLENFSTDYIELLSLLKALEVLYGENDLNPSGYFAFTKGTNLKKNSVISARFSDFAISLEAEIVRLLQAKEDNVGYPLLVALARYLVIQKSISEEKIFFLDSFGKNHSLVVGEATQNKLVLAGVYDNISKELNKQLQKLGQETLMEKDYTVLEDMANREREILYGLNESRAIRVNFEIMLPSKEESMYLYRYESSDTSLLSLYSIYEANRDKYSLALQKKYSFNLFSRNCTTEIFRTLNSFLKNEEEGVERIGGIINGSEPFVFVPVYAYYLVEKKYRVVAEEIMPSLRTRILRRNSSNGFFSAMRESSTLTSKFYKFNKEDSFFIFFTDDAIWQRPIYGFINLIAGLSETSIGICIAPYDKGERLVKGLQGIFFSGPELVFFNIRKGTFIFEGKDDWIEGGK